MRILRALLLLVAVGSLSWTAVQLVRMHFVQRELRKELEQAAHRGLGGEEGAPGAPADTGSGALVGRIEIPRVGMDVMALEGVRDHLLDQGAGHIRETPLPGMGGNSVFAAHRDTFFRRLRDVVEGDSVRVTTPWGSYAYTVDSIRVVDPADVWVLDQEGREKLTMITCYPFDWLGPAKQRIVVTALPVVPTS